MQGPAAAAARGLARGASLGDRPHPRTRAGAALPPLLLLGDWGRWGVARALLELVGSGASTHAGNLPCERARELVARALGRAEDEDARAGRQRVNRLDQFVIAVHWLRTDPNRDVSEGSGGARATAA
eukprot:6034507-Prymnesium_polylepis.1